jgi:hypothetical protein
MVEPAEVTNPQLFTGVHAMLEEAVLRIEEDTGGLLVDAGGLLVDTSEFGTTALGGETSIAKPSKQKVEQSIDKQEISKK